jgi:hypothetical protein
VQREYDLSEIDEIATAILAQSKYKIIAFFFFSYIMLLVPSAGNILFLYVL